MATEVELLRQIIDRGFTDMGRRFDDLRDMTDQRHDENLDTLRAANAEVKRVDLRVHELSTRVAEQGRDLVVLFARRTFASWLIGASAGLLTILWTLHLLKVIP